MNEITLLTGKRIYQAFAAGDLEALAALCHPDVVLDVPGSHPNAGRWTGPDGVLAFIAASTAVADTAERIEVVDLLAGERHVAAVCHVTGERAGRAPLENDTVHLHEVDDDGLVRSIRFHNTDQAAVDEFWG